MQIGIRPAGAGDAVALAAVGQATFLETYAGALDVGDVLDHCEVEHGAPRYAAWLRRRAIACGSPRWRAARP